LLYVGGTTKYLKGDVHPLMPTKLKGMTSLEIAIIVAIVLVIAVAVGWYLYTTFIAAAGGQPRLNIVSAELTGETLKLVVVNPGPVDVQISQIEIAGQVFDHEQTIRVGQREDVTVTVSGVSAVPGTMLPGRVILSGGQSFPFSAVVKPGGGGGGDGTTT
jgi:type IV pilus assembly protein PilA